MRRRSLPLCFLVIGVCPSLLANVHTPIAAPSYIVAGVETSVTISTYIPDPTLIAGSVNLIRVGPTGQLSTILGVLNDSGTNGDATAGDHVYSIQLGVSASATFEVSAAFRGVLRRQVAPVNVTALSIPAIRTSQDFNTQAEDFFASSLSVRTALESLGSGMFGSTENGVATLGHAIQQLANCFISFEAVSEYLSTLGILSSSSQSSIRQIEAIPLSVKPSDVTLPFIPGASNLLDAANGAQTYENDAQLFANDGTDRNIPDLKSLQAFCFAQGYLTQQTDLTDPSMNENRHLCAVAYGFPKAIDTVRVDAQNIAVEEAFGPLTDFLGDGIGALFQLSTVTTQAVTGAVGYAIDLFTAQAHASGVIVMRVANPGTVQLPIGKNTLIYSFGGAEPPAVAQDITVLMSGNPPITFVPGQNQKFLTPLPTQFVSTGNMTTPRLNHTATLLKNGMVLIAGGANSTDLASAELYNPTSGKFTPTGGMNLARSGHTATLLSDGRVLIAGGTTAAAEIYDPSTGTFHLTGNMTTIRRDCVAALLNTGKVLVAGGIFSTFLESAELYDPATGTFAPTGNMTMTRDSPTAQLLANGSVLVVGGDFNPGGATHSTPTAEVYDPTTGTFTATGSMARGRTYQTETPLASGDVLVTGGLDFSVAPPPDLATAESYDPMAGTFAPAGNMSIGRIMHTATLLPNASVLVVGGFNSNLGRLSTSEIFDPASNMFVAGPSLNTPRDSHTATLLTNGAVLITGGESNTNVLASAEISH